MHDFFSLELIISANSAEFPGHSPAQACEESENLTGRKEEGMSSQVVLPSFSPEVIRSLPSPPL